MANTHGFEIDGEALEPDTESAFDKYAFCYQQEKLTSGQAMTLRLFALIVVSLICLAGAGLHGLY
ncbi:hypothetical protein [Palleronia abyssalis]|uniref:Uncharacterized protein n=1 Tax=Palleronia abyssalis TaxID=1501240 RepID=A0A2R8BV89_9RHOB|nr:hypothetical protein [Palleronia abyssalis]SPJ24071.1 hypothetical protein PAA8504_01896 [Palleronia abyssalis]